MTFNAAEKHQSQVPALQLLVALGFTPLSQEEALRLRGGRLRNVVLDDVLADQLMRINRFTHRGREYSFDLEDAHEAMRRLKPTPDRLKGLRGTNQDIYDTLVLGTTITKSIDGDSKSYSFRLHRLGAAGEQRLPRHGRVLGREDGVEPDEALRHRRVRERHPDPGDREQAADRKPEEGGQPADRLPETRTTSRSSSTSPSC